MQVLSIPDYFFSRSWRWQAAVGKKAKGWAALCGVCPHSVISKKAEETIFGESDQPDAAGVDINAKRKEGAIGNIVYLSTNVTGSPATEHKSWR